MARATAATSALLVLKITIAPAANIAPTTVREPWPAKLLNQQSGKFARVLIPTVVQQPFTVVVQMEFAEAVKPAATVMTSTPQNAIQAIRIALTMA